MTDKLECPNCGEKSSEKVYLASSLPFEVVHRGRCIACDFAGPRYPTKAEAINAWQMPHARKDEREAIVSELRAWLTQAKVYTTAYDLRNDLADLLDGMETNK